MFVCVCEVNYPYIYILYAMDL